MNFSDNKSFCALAWTHVAADPDGSVKLCCVQNQFVRKDNGDIYNLGYDKIEDFYNSTHYQQIRQDMLDGKLIPGCDQCYDKEKSNGISHRNRYNNLYKSTRPTSTIADLDIKYFDIRFGNLCNLACRSCSPSYSSQLSKEATENKEIRQYFNIVDESKINSWYNTELFLENFNKHSYNIDYLYITGGEPTLIEKNYELLESLIETGKAKNITLKFNTNITNIHNRLLKLLPEFKKVLFFLSIDGYENIQEYLRYPSKWEQIDKNIHKLLEIYKSSIVFTPTPVVQALNIGNITDLFEYFENFNRKYSKSIFQLDPIILFQPEPSTFFYLPMDYKKKCWDKIENWVTNNCRFQTPLFHARMREIKNICFTEYPLEEKPQRFLDFSANFDKIRNQSLKDTNPELYQILIDLTK